MNQAPSTYSPAGNGYGAKGAASVRALSAYADASRAEPEKAYEPPYSHGVLIEMFEEAEDATREARKLAERCRDYYDNKQLTAEERKILTDRGQPEVVRNQIRGKVNFWLGFEAKNRSDPRAESEHGTTEEEASDATDMLRFQERRADLDQKFSDCWEHMLIEGYAGIEVLGPSERDERVIEVKRWKWDRLFFDPASSEHDFSDATYVGGVVWMDARKARKMWPDADRIIAATTASALQRGSTYDDKPKRMVWATGAADRERILIAQMYYECEGRWHWALFTMGGVLEQGPVELVDEQGNSVCPMILQALYVDRDNNRYGEVAEFLSPQDEINKHASKALHRLNSSQTIGEHGAILDVDELKRQKARPDGHIELPPGAMDRFKFVEHTTQVAQGRDMMMDAVLAIEKRGPNAALMGTQSGGPSGRAIRANQEGGMIEGARPRDRYNHLKTRVYRAMWQRIRQFSTAETWITVTDDEGAARHVGFNRQTTVAEAMAERARRQGMADEEIATRLQQMMQDPARAMELQQPTTLNVPMEMDLNINIEPATESVTMAHEAFEMLATRPDVPLPVLMEFWPGSARQKKRIRDTLGKFQAQQAEGSAQASALQADNLMADTEAKRAKAMKDIASADEAQMATKLAPAETAARVAPQAPAGDVPMYSEAVAPGSPYAVA